MLPLRPSLSTSSSFFSPRLLSFQRQNPKQNNKTAAHDQGPHDGSDLPHRRGGLARRRRRRRGRRRRRMAREERERRRRRRRRCRRCSNFFLFFPSSPAFHFVHRGTQQRRGRRAFDDEVEKATGGPLPVAEGDRSRTVRFRERRQRRRRRRRRSNDSSRRPLARGVRQSPRAPRGFRALDGEHGRGAGKR